MKDNSTTDLGLNVPEIRWRESRVKNMKSCTIQDPQFLKNILLLLVACKETFYRRAHSFEISRQGLLTLLPDTIMSTLEYLDDRGTVNFTLVPWETLHKWLSQLNGNIHVEGGQPPPRGVNRGKVIAELDKRHKKSPQINLLDMMLQKGYGRDWTDKENNQGYTHLEELLIYQPKDWRIQAREYFYVYNARLDRTSSNEARRTSFHVDDGYDIMVEMPSPVMVVLFHQEIPRSKRYEPLNFLLAYGVNDPCPKLFEQLECSDQQKEMIWMALSPLDYFFEFQQRVDSYRLDLLRTVGKRSNFRRLCLIKELDFCDIVGQRMAKQIIREEVVRFIWDRSPKKEICANPQPLSMIFAGPSGIGKTEMAMWLAALLNKPADKAFLKVDCGKITDDKELFGMSGPYRGSEVGSALNNFILQKSNEPDSIGVVLLDEIEKAHRGVLHGLYQVFDKGEWTNKKLESESKSQTETVSCSNIIFILTTNSATHVISEQVKLTKLLYTADASDVEEELGSLEHIVRKTLQRTHPFTDAFIGRVGRIVPFLPLANEDPEQHALLGESMAVAKLLIEQEQERLMTGCLELDVKQIVTPKHKHKMASLVIMESIPEAGVRSIQKIVATKMGNRMKHALLKERDGIRSGSSVRYAANEDQKRIEWYLVGREVQNVMDIAEEDEKESELTLDDLS